MGKSEKMSKQENQEIDVFGIIIVTVFIGIMILLSFVQSLIICLLIVLVQMIIKKTTNKNIPFWVVPSVMLFITVIYSLFNIELISNSFQGLADMINVAIDTTKENGFSLGILTKLIFSFNFSFNYILFIFALIITVTLSTKLEKIVNRFMFKKDYDSDENSFDGIYNNELIDYDYSKHLSIFGTTGTGKGANLMWWGIHSLIKNKYLMFIDGKGGYQKYDSIPLLKLYSKVFNKDLRIIDLDDYKNSSPFNPFKNMDDATAIKDYLVTTIEWEGNQQYYKNNAERFWQMSASVMLQYKEYLGMFIEQSNSSSYLEWYGDLHFGLIIHFCNIANFNELVEYLSNHNKKGEPLEFNENAVDGILKRASELENDEDLDSIITRAERIRYLRIAEECSNGVDSSINQFATMYEGIGKYIFSAKPNAFDITDFINAKGNMVIAVRLNVQFYASFSSMVGRMMILESDRSTKVKQLSKETSVIKGVYIFDELRTYYTEKITDILDKARNSNTKVIVTMLTPSDLGQEVANRIINLCDEVVCLRFQDDEGLSILSKSLGTYDTFFETIVIEKNHLLDFSMKSGEGSMRETKEYVLHPNKILQLKDLQFYYVVKSEHTVSQGITKFIPTNEDELRELFL